MKGAPVGEDLVGAIDDEGGAQQCRAHRPAPHHLEIVFILIGTLAPYLGSCPVCDSRHQGATLVRPDVSFYSQD